MFSANRRRFSVTRWRPWRRTRLTFSTIEFDVSRRQATTSSERAPRRIDTRAVDEAASGAAAFSNGVRTTRDKAYTTGQCAPATGDTRTTRAKVQLVIHLSLMLFDASCRFPGLGGVTTQYEWESYLYESDLENC